MTALIESRVLKADIVFPTREPMRARFIACCSSGGCSALAGTSLARACTRTDCGLSDRFHDIRSDAA